MKTVKLWIRHNMTYNQKFPWPGWFSTMRSPYYRKIYLNSGGLPKDIFQIVYQKSKTIISKLRGSYKEETYWDRYEK